MCRAPLGLVPLNVPLKTCMGTLVSTMSPMPSPPNSLSPHASKMPSSPTAKELRRVASIERGRSRVLARGYPDGKFGFIYVIGRAVPPVCYLGGHLTGQTSSCPPLSLSLSFFLSLSLSLSFARSLARSRTHTHSLSRTHTQLQRHGAGLDARGQICGGVRLCVLQLPRRRPGGRQASNNVAHRGLPDRALLGQGVAAVREPFDCDDTQRVTQPVLPELWQHGKPVSHQQWPGRMQGPGSQPC